MKLLGTRYEIRENIGNDEGFMYKAKDKHLDKFVAIKIIGEKGKKDCINWNFIKVFDIGYEGNIHYVVMDLIDGIALSNCYVS